MFVLPIERLQIHFNVKPADRPKDALLPVISEVLILTRVAAGGGTNSSRHWARGVVHPGQAVSAATADQPAGLAAGKQASPPALQTVTDWSSSSVFTPETADFNPDLYQRMPGVRTACLR
uniref:guanine nucleotide-binding protein G(I)/G(S)/G(O) subunit gamma-13b isoform X1 n=1 Tax=Monopterus albus TaxID=43700 RepID=UPI0009B3E6C7|nr:uncharacterized protein LOC109967528 isoform X1 [Monopterus albus]